MPASTGSSPAPSDSSASTTPAITPLHNPAKGAVVVQQQAPLGSTHPNTVIPGQTPDPSVPGAALGAKALLAKKFAKPSTISPTDALQSPCTQKLADAKGRRFSNKWVGVECALTDRGKPASLASRLNALQDENAK
ncbi:hypothetical protein VHUM_01791 [Vanrija humicola]|uniref:Uncharacterized protein n=1 Tax=Vanrija humicola TaxID=5417 RepID=A0A7D8Z4T9_VANHU|nr:hypothetical protein VHUM_01791 [Vanrija humicola]